MSGIKLGLARIKKQILNLVSKSIMQVRGIPVKNIYVDGIIRIKGKPCECIIGSNLRIVSNMWSNPLGGGTQNNFFIWSRSAYSDWKQCWYF